MTARKSESIRQYCKRVGFKIVGKLKYMGVTKYGKLWIDQAGNEYSKVFYFESSPKSGYYPGVQITRFDGVIW